MVTLLPWKSIVSYDVRPFIQHLLNYGPDRLNIIIDKILRRTQHAYWCIKISKKSYSKGTDLILVNTIVLQV